MKERERMRVSILILFVVLAASAFVPGPAAAQRLDGIASSVAVDPTGRYAAIGHENGGIQMVDLALHRVARQVRLPLGQFMGRPQFSLDGKQVRAYDRTRVHTWDLTSGEVESLRVVDGDPATSRVLAFSPDGRWVACENGNGLGGPWIDLHDGRTGRRITTIRSGIVSASRRAGEAAVNGLLILMGAGAHCGDSIPRAKGDLSVLEEARFRPDGSELAVAHQGRVRFFGVPGGRRLRSISTHFRESFGLGYSPDGAILAALGDGKLKLHDGRTGSRLLDLDLGLAPTCVTFRPDGQELALIRFDRVMTFAAPDWKPRQSVTFDFFPYALAWATGPYRVLVTGGRHGLIQIDAKTGRRTDLFLGRR